MSRRDLLASQIQKELSHIIQNKLNSDVGFVSVARVEVSNDCSFAKVFLSFLGQGEKNRFEKISNAKGFIRGMLAKSLRMKKVPEIAFVQDQSLKEGDRIIQKLAELDLGK
jgi:ribosome-binding factor A